MTRDSTCERDTTGTASKYRSVNNLLEEVAPPLNVPSPISCYSAIPPCLALGNIYAVEAKVHLFKRIVVVAAVVAPDSSGGSLSCDDA